VAAWQRGQNSFGRQAGRLRRLRRPDHCPTATDYALSDSDREMKENCHDHQRNNARNLAVHIRLDLPSVVNDSHSPTMYAIELDFRLRAFDARSRPNSLHAKAVNSFFRLLHRGTLQPRIVDFKQSARLEYCDTRPSASGFERIKR
jgi:hypothetical protein